MKKYIIAFIFSVLAIYFSKDFKVVNAGILLKILSLSAGTFVGYSGYIFGSKVRDWIAPDFIVASDVSSLAKSKVFWAIGLQAIGCFFGAMLGTALIFSWFGPSRSEVAKQKYEIAYETAAPLLDEWKNANAAKVDEIRKRIDAQNGDSAMPPFRLTAEERDKCVEYEVLQDSGKSVETKIIPYYSSLSAYLESRRISRDEHDVWKKYGS